MLHSPGVKYLGRIGQQKLADEFMSSSLWAFPTWFTETFCITSVEAMASGTPAITSDLAALQTTVGDNGILIKGQPHEQAYQAKFVKECAEMLTNKERWKKYSDKGKEAAKQHAWSLVADKWEALINS